MHVIFIQREANSVALEQGNMKFIREQKEKNPPGQYIERSLHVVSEEYKVSLIMESDDSALSEVRLLDYEDKKKRKRII